MSRSPLLVALDLEGVLIPEIWIAVAEHTGVKELRLTTRDIPDYNELMRGRLRILQENSLTLKDIKAVVKKLDPLPGGTEFLNCLREQWQVIILSDTYYEFADPLIAKLGRPALFCNCLEVDKDGRIIDYRLRQPDGKRHAVEAFRKLNFEVLAAGDSYNDTTMLESAHRGILFRPSGNVKQQFPQFPVAEEYRELQSLIEEFAGCDTFPEKL